MLRRTVPTAAPTRAHFFARPLAPDFMGIRFNKPRMYVPYNHFYPMSICAGNQTRWFSGPLGGGHWHYRCRLGLLRNIVMIAPSVVLGGMLFFMADWWDLAVFAQALNNLAGTGWKIPASWEDARKTEMNIASREKPGYLLKHKLGGQISIAGSEINIA